MSRPVSSLQPLALAVLMACAVAPVSAAPAQSEPQTSSTARSFAIPAGELSQALNTLAEQADQIGRAHV